MHKLRVIFAGSGAFGLPTLRAIIGAQHEIVQIITQPDRPAGRGRKLTPTPIGEFATHSNLPLVRTENINVLSLPATDLMVVIAFGQKIAAHQVNHPHFGSVNLHASLLPKYRGAAPINWAILGGETETGNSIIRLAEKMDAGAILAQSHLAIGPLETAGELHDRLAADGGPLVLKVLTELAAGEATERIQDQSLATIAKKLTRQSAVLDFNLSAEEIARRIRGLYPWPGCRVRVIENSTEIGRLSLVRAIARPYPNPPPEYKGKEKMDFPPSPCTQGEGSGAEHGTLSSTGAIICGTGQIEILELQPEGKSPMTLTAYQNGHAWPNGAKIESVV